MDPTKWGAPYPIVVVALFVIVMLRANGTYWLGRGAVAGTERTKLRGLVHTPGYVRAAGWLGRWGAPAVTVSFLTVGIQTLVNLAAGVTRMPLRRYLPAVVVGSVAWAFIYATAGFVGVEMLGTLYDRSPVLAVSLGIALSVLFAGWVLLQVRGARRHGLAVTEAVPEPVVIGAEAPTTGPSTDH